MKIKAPYFFVLLALGITMLLAACGESAPTTAPVSQPTTAAATTQAQVGQPTAATTTAAITTAAVTTTVTTTVTSAKPTTAAATSASAGSNQSKVNVCELFSQGDAETALGTKVDKSSSKDNAGFYTCFYSTFNDGKLKAKDISQLSVLVYTREASQSWYTSVKKEYEAQTAGKGLTPVAGLGNDAFYYVVDSGLNGGKAVHLSVLKGKTYFSISVDNTKLDEAQQLAQIKDLAQKIATKF